ncbi:hypothetical protein LCGC14_1040750 [marine sediment metagenome]|uniref:PD-(D/E)XK endonuclease-like domain-containing protein n=2 Tax=marine sediment metagenome TaxID=412755 RepID=A0A0F9MRL9_9ZZZZ
MDATDLLEQMANACEAWDSKNLRFEADGHKYSYDGRPTTSVTQALRESGLTDSFMPSDQYYADFGTAVHQAVHYYNEGDLDMDALDPELLPCVQGWIDWKAHAKFEPVVSELIVCDPIFCYAGTLDMIGLMSGHRRPVLIDLKTGQVPKTAGLQMAGYAHCLPFKVDRLAVQLPRDGGFKTHTFKDDQDEKVFLAALAVANWKRRVA